MLDILGRYGKFGAAILAAAASAFVAALSDGLVTETEWINVAIAAVGAASVLTAPNVPGAAYTKFLLAGMSAVLTFLTSAITDGVSKAESMQMIAVAVGAFCVLAVPNKDRNRSRSS